MLPRPEPIRQVELNFRRIQLLLCSDRGSVARPPWHGLLPNRSCRLFLIWKTLLTYSDVPHYSILDFEPQRHKGRKEDLLSNRGGRFDKPLHPSGNPIYHLQR